MTRIDEDDVRRIARLAGLELDGDEVADLAGDLVRILEHFDELGEAEPEEAPGPDGDDGAPLRPDVPSSDPMAAGPERAAPDWRDGFFVVPRLPGMEGPDGDAS